MARLFMSLGDIEEVLGKGTTSASKLSVKIKAHYKLSNRQYISVEQFCAYTGLTVALVMAQMRK